MRHLPTVLLLLSLPAGVVGYAIGVWLVGVLPLPEPVEGVVALFVPLLIGGLCMLPLVAPFFDQMAKRDLARRPTDESARKEQTGRRRRRR